MGFSPQGVQVQISPEIRKRPPLINISNIPTKNQRIQPEIRPAQEKKNLKDFSKSVTNKLEKWRSRDFHYFTLNINCVISITDRRTGQTVECFKSIESQENAQEWMNIFLNA